MSEPSARESALKASRMVSRDGIEPVFLRAVSHVRPCPKSRGLRPAVALGWWAHLEFTRTETELTIRKNQIDDLREARTTLLNAAALQRRRPWLQQCKTGLATGSGGERCSEASESAPTGGIIPA